MTTVKKYEIWKQCFQAVFMPEEATILSVQEDDGEIVMWALVDDKKPSDFRDFEVFKTETPIPVDMGIEREYVGTVQCGSEEYHVFERTN